MAGFGALVFWRLHTPPSDFSFYKEMLGAARITESVSVNGNTYLEKDGSVYDGAVLVAGPDQGAALLLAYEKSVARRNPLMAIAGTDSDRMDAAVRQLIQTQRALAESQSNLRDSALILGALYPIDFLRSISNLERMRQQFLKSGDSMDATRYELALTETANAYEEDLEKFRRGFTQAVPPGTSSYVTEGGHISRTGILNVIDTRAVQAHTTEQNILKRQRCFSGEVLYCTKEDISLPVHEKVLTQKTRAPSATELKEGPITQLTDPTCTAGFPTSVFFLEQTRTTPQFSYVVPRLIGDARLIDTATQSTVPFYSFFASRGMRYIPNSPMAYYECASFVHDASGIFTTDAIRDLSIQKPLSTYAHSFAKPLGKIENSLVSKQQALNEVVAMQYVALGLEALQQQDFSEEGAHVATELSLIERNRSGGYDNQIFDIAALESANAQLSKRGVPIGLGLLYLFYVRNAFEIFFMIDNQSVGPVDTVTEGPATPPAQQPYVYYSNLTPEQKKQADRDQEYYFSIHGNPSLVQ